MADVQIGGSLFVRETWLKAPNHYQTESYDQAETHIRYKPDFIGLLHSVTVATDWIVQPNLIVDRGLKKKNCPTVKSKSVRSHSR